ncbi:hypothetical protein SORBI_3004G075250 [Sorghum bicolor]|uniref:Uncharacterized protein n=1 Tax=Sorghum bicolor TaxID=4558 RepID=A0A1Z5RLE2_SORBI|nr:hypothetical protein SORBI_3004G075250 [Sorghum bicolor]
MEASGGRLALGRHGEFRRARLQHAAGYVRRLTKTQRLPDSIVPQRRIGRRAGVRRGILHRAVGRRLANITHCMPSSSPVSPSVLQRMHGCRCRYASPTYWKVEDVAQEEGPTGDGSRHSRAPGGTHQGVVIEGC